MNVMAQSLSDSLTGEFPSKVASIKPSPPPRQDAGQLADNHRKQAHWAAQRIADAKRTLKADLALIASDRKVIKAQFERDLAGIIEQIADAKDKANRDIEADKRLVAASRAALDALAE